MEIRPFGKTEASFPILGFGGQRIVDEHGCGEADAIEILNTAIDRGIRYFDTAWIYSRGQAETRLGKVARHRRSEMWIATKTLETTKNGARQQLQESLDRLQTNYVDEWRLHNIFDYPRLDAFTCKDGALEAAIEARHEGRVRFISISGHTDPEILVEALNRYPFDSAMIPVSALDHFKLSFVDEFLPIAIERGIASIGMKALALGRLSHEVRRALQYCFSLPLSMVTSWSKILPSPNPMCPWRKQKSRNFLRISNRWFGRICFPGNQMMKTTRPAGHGAAKYLPRLTERKDFSEHFCGNLWGAPKYPFDATAIAGGRANLIFRVGKIGDLY
jgi:aryl-alcohol dehydrogenase-like predicted oxidoreductase